MNTDQIHVYPVGLLRDLLGLARTIRHVPKRTRHSWRTLRYGFQRGCRRRSYWNGYLAELTEAPNEARPWRRCGHGWTKRRALADLERHLVEVGALREAGE